MAAPFSPSAKQTSFHLRGLLAPDEHRGLSLPGGHGESEFVLRRPPSRPGGQWRACPNAFWCVPLNEDRQVIHERGIEERREVVLVLSTEYDLARGGRDTGDTVRSGLPWCPHVPDQSIVLPSEGASNVPVLRRSSPDPLQPLCHDHFVVGQQFPEDISGGPAKARFIEKLLPRSSRQQSVERDCTIKHKKKSRLDVVKWAAAHF